MIDMLQIGARIQKQRDLCGYTQEALAEKIDCNAHYISEIENGRRRPSAYLLFSLAETLNMSLDYMIYGTTPSDVCPPALMNLIEMCSPEELKQLEYIVKALLEYHRSENQ